MSMDQPEPDAPADPDESNALLFGKWSVDDIEFRDVSTERYITVTPIAHTMGRHADKQFKKSQISIVERLINRLMQTQENTGKKQLVTRLVRDAFDIIHDRTGENPVQVLVRAVENSAPREETVRLKYGGISVPKAVDVSPQRRVDQALKFIAEGVYSDSFKSDSDAAEALARQLMGAANNDVDTYSVSQKEEKERVAAAAR
ncbi:30S ribosomal protein S7 [Halobacteriales archaeon QH_2_65_14]|nr:MAG: 30S ribosomal protein S7 [Halobacteriales archaeon QH_2_65_14]